MNENPKENNHRRSGIGWVRLRLAIQLLFLLAFLYLLALVTPGAQSAFPADLFFSLDPLAGISAMLARRVWLAPMALGLITLLLTLAVGRAWCGWLCPLGSVLDLMPSRKEKRPAPVSPFWSQVKPLIFLVVIIGAALGSLILVVLDPVTLLARTLSSVVFPGINMLFGGAQSWLYRVEFLRPAIDGIDGALRGWLLNSQSFYLPNLVLLVFFAVVLGLNAVRPRFWCRYLCPLGGMLGLLSRLAHIRHRVNEAKCISCRRCVAVCPTGAIAPEKKFSAEPAECILCLQCQKACPTGAISFGKVEKRPVFQDVSRRRFLVSLGSAAAGALLLRFVPAGTGRASGHIRPPGSSEDSLYRGCIGCGQCLRVCPTGVLQPSATGDRGKIWTPALDMRHGYCDYSCNACGLVCPTGAITGMPLEKKRRITIGVARIERSRCFPWTGVSDCAVCEEMCPVPQKAIRLSGSGRGAGGRLRPHVVEDLCIGCGICEHYCPVSGEAAIKVYSVPSLMA